MLLLKENHRVKHPTPEKVVYKVVLDASNHTFE